MHNLEFLLEMASVYPAATDGSEVSAEEECLAATLFDRLGIPKTPVVADELEKEDVVVIPAGIKENEEDQGDLDPEVVESFTTEVMEEHRGQE